MMAYEQVIELLIYISECCIVLYSAHVGLVCRQQALHFSMSHCNINFIVNQYYCIHN